MHLLLLYSWYSLHLSSQVKKKKLISCQLQGAELSLIREINLLCWILTGTKEGQQPHRMEATLTHGNFKTRTGSGPRVCGLCQHQVQTKGTPPRVNLRNSETKKGFGHLWRIFMLKLVRGWKVHTLVLRSLSHSLMPSPWHQSKEVNCNNGCTWPWNIGSLSG